MERGVPSVQCGVYSIGYLVAAVLFIALATSQNIAPARQKEKT